MISPVNKITASLLLLVLCSCGKHYKIDGQVLSKHGIPIPGARVKMYIADGGHSCCEKVISDTTDINGKFLFNGYYALLSRQYCYNVECTVKDSGFSEMHYLPPRAHMRLQLK